MLYGIFCPESEIPLGLIESFFEPTVDEMADALADQLFFGDRAALAFRVLQVVLGVEVERLQPAVRG